IPLLAPELTVDAEPALASFKDTSDNEWAAWATSRGLATFYWRQLGVHSQKPSAAGWLSPLPQQVGFSQDVAAKLRTDRAERFDDIFNADHIYAETWAARWFPLVRSENPLDPIELSPHQKHLDFEPFLPRSFAYGGALILKD